MSYRISIFADETLLTSATSNKRLDKTLFHAARLLRGIPGAWCGIRQDGRLVADLETNWRGEITEANIHQEMEGWPFPACTVVPLNPAGPIFTR